MKNSLAANDYIVSYNYSMNATHAVVTIQEAAEMYCYAQNTIRYHMNRGNLEFRKVGGDLRGVYLISLASLIKLWGNPRKFVS